jgi:uncharacterized protein
MANIPVLTPHRVFFGPEGLRAGWRALAFLVLMAALESQAGYLLKVQHTLFGEGESAAGTLLIKTILFISLVVIVLIFGAFERRSLAVYGLPLRKTLGRDFWSGTLWGFGILTVNIALMVLRHAYSFGTIVLPAWQVLKYAVSWAGAYFMVGLAEEFGFRGYLQYTLTRGIGFWPASVVTSILFGLAHLDVQGESWPAIVNIALLALFLCMALRRTGSLWFGIGSHMAFDWGLTFFYSCDRTNVRGHLFNASLLGDRWFTGGSAGPEGNIFNVFLVAAGILLLSKVYPQVKYPTTASATSENLER